MSGTISQTRHSVRAMRPREHARLFAALGDATRLALVTKLAFGQPRSISQLTKGSKLTRQAISKHLRILASVGMVQSIKRGREKRFELKPQPIEAIKKYLDFVSEQWDQTLSQLKSFVE